MRSSVLRGLVTTVALLVVIAVALRHALWVPSVQPASAPPDRFSAERAMAHDREIARTPHAIGGPGHDRVRDYLLQELARLGVPAEVQRTTGIGTRYQVAGRVQNVVARLAGREHGPAVLLMAHYDAVPASFGAGDDGSGTVTLLETLRALRAGAPLQHDVIALFTDGEEAGLLGAAAFVREHPWAKDVGVTINVEARGTRGPSLMFETGPGNLDVARVLRHVSGARATSLSTAVYRRLPNDTDLSELALLGGPALNFAFIGGVDRYHTQQDDIAHLDPRSVQHHGEQVLALARAFGDGPLPRPKTGDAVFFDFPGVGLVAYPESWAMPLAVLALLLVIAGSVVARRRARMRLGAIAIGAVATVVSAALAAVVATGLALALGTAHASIGSGRIDLTGWYVAATAALSFAISAAAYRLLRRWQAPEGLHAGALAAWGLLSLLVAMVLPGGSFLFTWPLLVAALAFLVAPLVPARAAITAHAVGSIVAILIIAPIGYLMGSVALGLAQGGVVIALLTALAAWLLVPLFVLLGDRSWWPAGIAALVAVLLVAIGLATVRTDADHPAGTTFVYAVDADSGTAWLSANGATPAARAWARAEVQAMTGSELDLAPSWVAYFAARRAARVPRVDVAPAAVHVVSDSTVGTQRVVTLHVVPGAGTQGLTLRAEGVVNAAVDGLVVDTTRFRSHTAAWVMEYVAPDPSGLTLRLTFHGAGPRVLELAARRAGLPAAVRPPRRLPGFIPIQRGDVSVAYQRVRI